jgi:hypothetical protein
MFPREAVLRLWPDVLAVEQEQPTKEGQAADARDTERFTAPNGAARPPIHAPADTGPPSAHERQASGDATPAEAAAVPAGGQAVTESAVERLAEWIFAQRPLLQHFRKLLDAACQNDGLGKFKRADFITAYKRVYASEPHAPPITGWPLREPFKSRAEEVKPPPSGRPEKPRK